MEARDLVGGFRAARRLIDIIIRLCRQHENHNDADVVFRDYVEAEMERVARDLTDLMQGCKKMLVHMKMNFFFHCLRRT